MRRNSKPRTLLIYPPFHRLHGLRNRFFPIGLGYLAGSLKAAGFEAAIYNAENYDDQEPMGDGGSHLDVYEQFQRYQDALDDPGHYVWQETRAILAEYRPDIVGITAKSCMIPSALMTSRIARELNRDTVIVWGGPHASVAPDDTVRFDNVDFVVRHEGERTVVELVTALASGEPDWSTIDGLVWKDDSGLVVHNKRRVNAADLDTIPMPDKSADVMPWRYRPDDYGVMFTSRGCAWGCTFCDSRGVWTRTIRYRTPEHIVAEMVDLYDRYGVRDFYFWDDTLTPNKKHSHRVFDAIIAAFHDRGLPITWQGTTRCDCVDDALAEKMKRSGCRLLAFGVESGSAPMMAILKKGITRDKVQHAEAVMNRAGIPWDAFFMIGFPDETAQSIDETMALIRTLKCRSVGMSIFTPYPGTEMHDRARAYGLIAEPIAWREFSHQSPKNHFVKNITRTDFAEIARRCFEEVDHLNRQRYRRERLRHFVTHPRQTLGKLLSEAGAQR